MQRFASLLIVAGLVIAGLSLAACSPSPEPAASPTPSVDEATATEMAQHALEALDAGDYRAWSRDWSETLKGAIGESAFLAFREQARAQLGAYVAIEDTLLTSVQPGTHRWEFTVRFEKATATLSFGFIDGGTAIEGVNLS
jgi:hypothetical protein